MPNTEPALDSSTLVAEVLRRAEAAGLARVYPIGALTKARAGVELAPYHVLADAGCVAFSDDGTTVRNALRAAQRRALRERLERDLHLALRGRRPQERRGDERRRTIGTARTRRAVPGWPKTSSSRAIC